MCQGQKNEAKTPSSSNAANEQYLSMMQRFKAEGWSEERLTQELMARQGCKVAHGPAAPGSKRTTDVEFLELKALFKKEGWSEEEYTRALGDLADARALGHWEMI